VASGYLEKSTDDFRVFLPRFLPCFPKVQKAKTLATRGKGPKIMFNFNSPYFAIVSGSVFVAFIWLFTKTPLFRSLDPFMSPPKPPVPRPIAPSVPPEHERELLALVCPEVRAVLEDELSAGNRIIDGGKGDWPWPDSVVIALGFIFKSEPKALPSPLKFQHYNIKVADGDSIYCLEHRIAVFAAMPTLEQHVTPDVLAGHKREARLRELAN